MSLKVDSVHRFGPADTGKRVVTAAGDVVGDIDRVTGGTAYVRPEPGLLDGHGSILTSHWPGVDTLPLDERQVTSVTDEAVVLKAGDSERRAPAGER